MPRGSERGRAKRALASLKRRFQTGGFANRGASPKALERAKRALGAPDGLLELFAIHDGLDGGHTFLSIGEATRMYRAHFASGAAKQLVPFGNDGRFNFVCVVREGFPGAGSVVWYPIGEPNQLLASSIARYLELLDERCGELFTEAGAWRKAVRRRVVVPWPDADWLKARDPTACALLDDPKFGKLLDSTSKKPPAIEGFSLDTFGDPKAVLAELTKLFAARGDQPRRVPGAVRELVKGDPKAAAALFRARALDAAKWLLVFDTFGGNHRSPHRRTIDDCRDLAAVERWLKRLPTVKHLAMASETELRALRDELRTMATRECLLVILEASGAKIPAWLCELIRARANGGNLDVSYAAAGESATLVENIRLS